MKSSVKILLLCTLAISLLGVWVGRGSAGHWLLTVVPCLYIGGPVLLASGLFWLVKRQYGNTFLVTLVMVAVLVSGLKLGGLVSQHDVAKAQAFCESLTPQLEQMKVTTGQYPLSIEPIRLTNTTFPRLVLEQFRYTSDGTNFTLSFPDPEGILVCYVYESYRRSWNRLECYPEDLGVVKIR